MLRQELKYEFEAIFTSQVRQVRVPKIWDAFPRQTEPFCPELLVESLEVAEARCPDAIFPWCVWNIVENWRHCGALFAQLLSDNRTDVLYSARPGSWHKSGWVSYDDAWEACPVRCMGVLAHLTSPGLWRSSKQWPVVAALARLEAWWHHQTLAMPLLAAWYPAQLLGARMRDAVAARPQDVPPPLYDMLLKARIAGTAIREELLSSETMEAALKDAVVRELAPWPQALHGRGSICSPLAAAKRLAREDSARLRAAAGARSVLTAQAELVDIADRAVRFAVKCLLGAPQRVVAWFLEDLPIFTMLERATLPMFAFASTNRSTTVHGAVFTKQMVKAAGRPYASKLVFALKPGRDVVADKLRHDAVPGCWQQGLFRGVTRVATERRLTPERPLRLIEVGAASGDCHMQIVAVFGPSRTKALVLEPFPPALERLRRNLALNGLEGAVEVRAQGLGSRSERIPLCGDPRNDVSLFFSKCSEGATKFADIDVVSLADLLASSGSEFWDVLSIAPQILEGCPDAFQGLEGLERRVRYVSSGSCLVLAADFIKRGAKLDTKVDCYDI